MLRWFLDQTDDDQYDEVQNEMIYFVTEKLGLTLNDLEQVCEEPDFFRTEDFVNEEEKWIFYYRFLSAMNIGTQMSAKETEICKIIASRLDMHSGFVKALMTIIPQYIRKRIPENMIKYSFGAVKKSMVAAALMVPVGVAMSSYYA